MCRENGFGRDAVALTGFSWTRLREGTRPLDGFPRLGGRFFRSRIEEMRRCGMNMVSVAMFEEVDEGAAASGTH